MKYIALILCLTAFTTPVCRGQQADPLIFRELAYHFGTIEETGGEVTHDFVFTNNSGRTIRILSVEASCGCTTPDWTKTAVTPGKTGFIRAKFDPRGRPGYFNKSLTVTTDLGGNPIVLQIKGDVSDGRPAAVQLPVTAGNLRLSTRVVSFPKVYVNQPPTSQRIYIRNDGTQAVSLSEASVPAWLKVSLPAWIKPGETAEVSVTYNGQARQMLGFATDHFSLQTNESSAQTLHFTVQATMEEFYAPVSPEEALKGPILTIRQPLIDAGRLRMGDTVEKELALRNTGKKDLIIKALQPNCSCVTARVLQNVIKPGDSVRLVFSFRPQARSGTQQKAIAVYSNDPRNPVQRVSLSAFIDE